MLFSTAVYRSWPKMCVLIPVSIFIMEWHRGSHKFLLPLFSNREAEMLVWNRRLTIMSDPEWEACKTQGPVWTWFQQSFLHSSMGPAEQSHSCVATVPASLCALQKYEFYFLFLWSLYCASYGTEHQTDDKCLEQLHTAPLFDPTLPNQGSLYSTSMGVAVSRVS